MYRNTSGSGWKPWEYRSLRSDLPPAKAESSKNQTEMKGEEQKASSFGCATPLGSSVGSRIGSDMEGKGDRLQETDILESNNKKYQCVMQCDGNLVCYDVSKSYADRSRPFWASQTSGEGVPGFVLRIQPDGNLVIYDGEGRPTWASGTNGQGKGPYTLRMQDDRNLVVYDSREEPLWATNTNI